MKRILAAALSLSLMITGALSLTGCGAKFSGNQASPSPDAANGAPKKKVGIIQIVEHPSLNYIRETLIKQMEEKGFKDGDKITIDYQNAQNDQTNLKTISQKFVNGKYDLIIAIATPSALSAAGETKDIPVLFSAVTDPLGGKLVESLEKPAGNVTGVSDAVSAEQIMKLAKRITPDIKTVGALYNSGEANSISVVNELKEYGKNNGLTIVEATVTNASEVQQAAQSLAGKADAIFSPIDNTIASAMPIVADVANRAKIPVYVGADTMVKDGGLATYGVNYEELSKETGNMAAEILNGKNPGEIPVKMMTKLEIYVNKDTAKQIGITIPEDVLKEAAQVFGE